MSLLLGLPLLRADFASARTPPPQGTAQQEKSPAPPEKPAGPQDVAAPLPKGKKLILKDGDYHLVREIKREGERVRFYSVERSAWEEIPADLVNWEATRKAEVDEVKKQEELAEKVRATQVAERAAELDVGASIEISHGVFLPEGDGLFVVEGSTVTPLVQSNADAKRDKKRVLEQVLVPVPVVPSRQKIQLPGKHSALRITSTQPEFYMRTADKREPQMELVRAEVKGDTRLIEYLSTNIAGQQSYKRNAISIQSWQVARGVFRFTLSEPLTPGEYAMTEILPEGVNLDVWDFGVDAAGPPGKAAGKAPAKGKPKQSP